VDALSKNISLGDNAFFSIERAALLIGAAHFLYVY
jgi:hypothetical protein